LPHRLLPLEHDPEPGFSDRSIRVAAYACVPTICPRGSSLSQR
jgi:hypothetical protein